MQKIALPKKFKFIKGDNDNKGQIVIDPCYPGYGVTLGNALRRVMLSSLPGAAPLGVKIKGADHEFSTLSHLKEDLLEFVLNIKQLRLKMFTEEPVKLELKVHGKKEIKASDIAKNTDVEIINKDLVFGSITSMSGNIEMEITVGRGMGYETVEERETENKEIGFIEIDSIFSPVMNVGIEVENARVGKMTNWDKLVIDIETDGTISPEDAFKSSVDILIEQFSALTSDVKEETPEEAPEEDTSASSAQEAETEEK